MPYSIMEYVHREKMYGMKNHSNSKMDTDAGNFFRDRFIYQRSTYLMPVRIQNTAFGEHLKTADPQSYQLKKKNKNN